MILNFVATPSKDCISFVTKGEGPPTIYDFSKLGRMKLF